MKEISPSDELRKWFNHDPAKWVKFKHLYEKELALKQDESKKAETIRNNTRNFNTALRRKR